MKQTHLHAALLIAALAIAAFALAKSQSRGPEAKPQANDGLDILKALPGDASLALTLDFESEAAEPLRELLLRHGRELPDVSHLKDVCGYDPTPAIRQLGLALFAPKRGGDELAVGVASEGVFDPTRVADCARKLVERRGGHPSTTMVRGFQSIAGGPESMARIAVRPDGLVLIGEEKYLDRMLASAAGSAPSLADQASHRRLRREVGEKAPLLLSVVLPSGWLARFLPGEATQDSPIARVRGAALSLSFPGDAELHARIECTTDEACERLASLARKLWKTMEPALLRLAGAETAESARMSVADRALSFSWQLAPQTLEDLVFQWPAIERAASRLEPAPVAPPGPPASSVPFVPDQVIEAAPHPAGSITHPR